MTQLVQECSHHICEMVCLDNSEALLNDVAVSLLELPTIKLQADTVHSMGKISSELPPYSI